MREGSVAAVVVSYNRKELLSHCLRKLTSQSRRPDRVFIVDNASTDGTAELLCDNDCLQRRGVQVIRLSENIGGAGGFGCGVEHAMRAGFDWMWLMDDDAAPHSDALEELLKVAKDPSNIYGSLAISGAETSWMMTLLGERKVTTHHVQEIPASAQVQMLPFLGFFIHRSLVEKIGLPDAGFFIAADDVEYCVRARQAGADIIVAGLSHIDHPKSRPYKIQFFGYTLTGLELPPWKRYYDTRNRLLIARRHFGLKLVTQTIPGSFVRLIAALLREPNKLRQLHAFCAGMFDGLLGIKGKRHTKWGIK
ncbi:glycosyltransferase [Extensimonas vulgaris]|nr:glycosyltransferase [Extensimonas vulgaris]